MFKLEKLHYPGNTWPMINTLYVDSDDKYCQHISATKGISS